MKNLKLKVDEKKNVLNIEIDLNTECGLSKSGRSIIVGSSEGNIPVITPDGQYRVEKLNLSLTKPKPRD